MTFQRILIAVDGSPVSAHAADVGIELAQSLGGDLALICAVNPSLGSGADGGVTAGQLIETAKVEAKELLAEWRVRASGQMSVREFVEVRKPAVEIVKAARDWPADLIVIGSHGRSGIPRALLGSVAESVVRHADCPVLVVRGGQ